MDLESVNYPILCKEMDFDCLSKPAIVYIIASKEHFAIFIPLNDFPEISEEPTPENPHACIYETLVEEFYNLTEEYLVQADEHECPLPIPRFDTTETGFFGEFITLEGELPVMRDDGLDMEYIFMNGRFLFVAEGDTTIEEFLGTEDERRGQLLN